MLEKENRVTARRDFLAKTGLVVTGAALAFPVSVLAKKEQLEMEKRKKQDVEEVSPPEDLMREHGVLRRILLIYDDIQGRVNSGKEFSPDVLGGAANIIKKFIQDYHERLEEDYLFPRFRKAGKLVDLVKVLLQQHHTGRRLTAQIKELAAAGKPSKELGESLHLFARMYRPHAAREDTILFPALHYIVSSEEFDDMGEEFEDKERALFGKHGFEGVVNEVAKLEKNLGLYDLTHFTPPGNATGKSS